MSRSDTPPDMPRKPSERTVASRRASTRSAAGANEATLAETAARHGIRLSFLIHDVSRMRRTAFDQLMKPLGVTRAQWWVLAHLSRNDGMTQVQLADALEVGKASLGTLLEKLEIGGFIERKDDPVDRRAKRVFMAKAGQQVLKQMRRLEISFNERILVDISEQDRDATIRTLDRVKRALMQQIEINTAAGADSASA